MSEKKSMVSHSIDMEEKEYWEEKKSKKEINNKGVGIEVSFVSIWKEGTPLKISLETCYNLQLFFPHSSFKDITRNSSKLTRQFRKVINVH